MKMDLEIQITGSSPLDSRRTLPGKSDMLAFTDAFGDLYVQRPLPQHHLALRIHLRRTQGNRLGSAVKGILKRDEYLRMMVFAMRRSGCAVTGLKANNVGAILRHRKEFILL